jgi:hypothetical protein
MWCNRATHYERPVGPFQLHVFPISSVWFHDFNFMNSRFHLHEFTILTSWIHVFNIRLSRNSRSWNRKFPISNSRVKGFNFIVTSWSWNREFMKLKLWIRAVEIVNSWSWHRKFVKLKSWIHEVEIVNSWSWTLNSYRWNREFMKLKCPTDLSYYIPENHCKNALTCIYTGINGPTFIQHIRDKGMYDPVYWSYTGYRRVLIHFVLIKLLQYRCFVLFFK